MSDRDTFGPRLRAERERRGISLETLAAVTRVSAELWDGLERNDFSRWPSGIFARGFVRDYARAIGLDADELVDEFCRLFPIGDRRANRLIQAQAEFIGHRLAYTEPGAVPRQGDRRAAARQEAADARQRRLRVAPRTLAVSIDVFFTLSVAGSLSLFVVAGFWAWAGVVGLAYYSLFGIFLGATPGKIIVDALRQRMPALFALPDRRRAHA